MASVDYKYIDPYIAKQLVGYSTASSLHESWKETKKAGGATEAWRPLLPNDARWLKNKIANDSNHREYLKELRPNSPIEELRTRIGRNTIRHNLRTEFDRSLRLLESLLSQKPKQSESTPEPSNYEFDAMALDFKDLPPSFQRKNLQGAQDSLDVLSRGFNAGDIQVDFAKQKVAYKDDIALENGVRQFHNRWMRNNLDTAPVDQAKATQDLSDELKAFDKNLLQTILSKAEELSSYLGVLMQLSNSEFDSKFDLDQRKAMMSEFRNKALDKYINIFDQDEAALIHPISVDNPNNIMWLDHNESRIIKLQDDAKILENGSPFQFNLKEFNADELPPSYIDLINENAFFLFTQLASLPKSKLENLSGEEIAKITSDFAKFNARSEKISGQEPTQPTQQQMELFTGLVNIAREIVTEKSSHFNNGKSALRNDHSERSVLEQLHRRI